ncbi:MAG: hypothetical protein QXT26_04650 [Thermoproteota archaeon]
MEKVYKLGKEIPVYIDGEVHMLRPDAVEDFRRLFKDYEKYDQMSIIMGTLLLEGKVDMINEKNGRDMTKLALRAMRNVEIILGRKIWPGLPDEID